MNENYNPFVNNFCVGLQYLSIHFLGCCSFFFGLTNEHAQFIPFLQKYLIEYDFREAFSRIHGTEAQSNFIVTQPQCAEVVWARLQCAMCVESETDRSIGVPSKCRYRVKNEAKNYFMKAEKNGMVFSTIYMHRFY